MSDGGPESEAKTPFRVFLVEDDDDHAELTTFHLTKHAPDVAVERARDGMEAVERLLEFAKRPVEQRPTVVLLDLKLPKLDGLGVLERVRSEAALASLPMVMLSTSDADRDKAEAYRHHVNSYLVKPADFDAFQALMGDFVRYWRHCNQPLQRIV